MQRFILTGAPGAGKSMIARQLAAQGFETIAESATDIIAREQAAGVEEPWTEDGFIEKIARLQEQRIGEGTGAIQFHDRSPICTLALARHLDVSAPAALERLVERIATERLFAPIVFFVESLDFIEQTAARRIGLKEAQAFGKLHAETYEEFGYEPIPVPPAPVTVRAERIIAHAVAQKIHPAERL